MIVNTINEKQCKQDLKTCPKSVKQYVKALENDIERKQHLIDKALVKIKEQSKRVNANSSAKNRIEKGLVSFYKKIKRVDG